jgi:HlyD family secretion protein
MNVPRYAWSAVVAVALAACNATSDTTYQGWVEADMVFVSPDEAGRVETLSVREGDGIVSGAPLFTVDDDLQQADLRQNQATVTNARQAFERARVLLKTNVGTQKAFEDAEAVLRTAEARLNSSQTRLARRKIASPVAGTVQQIYFRPGELIPAGRPVVALLPAANIKLRFFVPEALLPKVALDDIVRVNCDGCPPDLTARIAFIARTAEFTPPVIYSLEERTKLVFLIEARPQRPDVFRVGQPVTVSLPSPGTKQ